ncbi:hypothetical protein D3C78_678680 [compost metagenome]
MRRGFIFCIENRNRHIRKIHIQAMLTVHHGASFSVPWVAIDHQPRIPAMNYFEDHRIGGTDRIGRDQVSLQAKWVKMWLHYPDFADIHGSISRLKRIHPCQPWWLHRRLRRGLPLCCCLNSRLLGHPSRLFEECCSQTAGHTLTGKLASPKRLVY